MKFIEQLHEKHKIFEKTTGTNATNINIFQWINKYGKLYPEGTITVFVFHKSSAIPYNKSLTMKTTHNTGKSQNFSKNEREGSVGAI